MPADAEELQEYLDAMTSFTAKISLGGTILLVNKAALAASGYSPDKLIGADFLAGPWFSFDPEVNDRVRKAFARACDGEPVVYDEKVQILGKKIITIALSFTLIDGKKGPWVLAEGRDVSEREAAMELLRERSEQLARSNHDLEMFASTASHDLQDPLRKITAMAELLERRPLSDEDRDLAGRMAVSARRLSTLIKDLLAMARVMRDSHPFEPVDLGEAARSALADLHVSGAEITIKDLPVVRGQPEQLRRLFQNLLSNALKFQPPGAKPVVLVEPRPAAPGFVSFAVIDNGIGFPREQAEEAFMPFRRLNPKNAYEGSGIGLAICRKIMARHGGWISAEPVPGQGTTIVVTLPSGPAVT